MTPRTRWQKEKAVWAAVLSGGVLVLLFLRGRISRNQDMAVVPSSEFRRGNADIRVDLPEKPLGQKPLNPRDVLLARADPGWRLSDERPARTVRLNAFAIDRTEVTNGQYREFLDWIKKDGRHRRCHPDEPSGKDHTPRYWGNFNPLLKDPVYARTAPFKADTFTAENQPVVGVDWYDAYAYARWRGKRLPTEAEWELACAGVSGWRWPWGNEWRWGYANVGGETVGFDLDSSMKKDGYVYAAPVGSFPAGRSPSGCYDMAGNVAEWVADWYQDNYYEAAPRSNPPGPKSGRFRVVRGGSFRNYPSAVRCAARAYFEPEFRSFSIGFRCAKDD